MTPGEKEIRDLMDHHAKLEAEDRDHLEKFLAEDGTKVEPDLLTAAEVVERISACEAAMVAQQTAEIAEGDGQGGPLPYLELRGEERTVEEFCRDHVVTPARHVEKIEYGAKPVDRCAGNCGSVLWAVSLSRAAIRRPGEPILCTPCKLKAHEARWARLEQEIARTAGTIAVACEATPEGKIAAAAWAMAAGLVRNMGEVELSKYLRELSPANVPGEREGRKA